MACVGGCSSWAGLQHLQTTISFSVSPMGVSQSPPPSEAVFPSLVPSSRKRNKTKIEYRWLLRAQAGVVKQEAKHTSCNNEYFSLL